MRHAIRSIALTVVVSLFSLPVVAATLRPRGNSVSGEVLVKIRATASGEALSGIEQGNDVDDGKKIATFRSGTLWRLHSRSLSSEALTASLQKNPNIEYVEPNYIVHVSDTPNDPSYASLWALRNAGQSVANVPGLAGADISAEGAWSVTKGSAAIVIGVVDTGVDYTHPDLAANIWSNPGGKGNALCAAGTHGFNAITGTCDPRDDHYHGTHVSGTIGAVGNNSTGVVGVNWVTSIMALKFLDRYGYGDTAGAIAAIDFAVQAKIDGVNVRVLSNSWGGTPFSKSLFDEINKANENDILFVAAAGNDSANNDVTAKYPASYATPNMIAVAATDNRDALAYFSNYGAQTVHLGAPGLNIYSCYPNGLYATLSGTSMAAPHVAGVAGLILAKTPSMTTAEVKSAILDHTDPIAALAGKTVTGGRLNAAAALGVVPAPAFTISATPASRTVRQGASSSYNVTVNPASGFAGSVSLSISGLPAGAGSTFTPSTTTSSSTLAVTVPGDAALGTYLLSIVGAGPSVARSTTVALTVNALTQSQCPTFNYSTYVGLGSTASSVVTADFNRDGRMDAAIAMPGSNRIAILLGRGDGAFTYSYTVNVGNLPLSIISTDFNRDSIPDLAVADANASGISILLGNGDGSFQAEARYAAGSNPFWLASGDFNGDGRADVVTANNGTNDVSILLGQGDGTLQSAINYPAGSGPFWVSVGEFNGDGKDDLAVADYRGNAVSILTGNGDGTFQSAVTYPVGSKPVSLAVGDFNGDGHRDLAVANYGSSNVSILAGGGNGTFASAVSYALGGTPNSITLIDADGDGKSDLVTANQESGTVSLLTGAGDGSFQPAVLLQGYDGPSQVAVADLNGDGRPDMVVANGFYATVWGYLNFGGCYLNCNTFAGAVDYQAGTAAVDIGSGDFNGDGVADFAVANGGANNVLIERGNGDGTVVAGASYNTGSGPHSIAIADVDRDGRLDLLVANSGADSTSVLRGNGDGTFQSAVNFGAGSVPHGVIAADFNRDGKVDLAVANSGSNNISILSGSGDGTFGAAISYPAGTSPEELVAGDFNRDGKLDLATVNSQSNDVSILIGNGDGTFQAASTVSAGTAPFAIEAGDFDRDGRVDLAVANRNSDNVSVLLGNGNGTFKAAINYAAGTHPAAVITTDVNVDGIADLAVVNEGSANLTVLTGNGDGAFGAGGLRQVGTNPESVVAVDLNRDGKPDLVVANSGSNTVSILVNTCPVPDMVLTKTHSGTFVQGNQGRVYTLTARNSGLNPTSGAVTVKDALPNGLTATSMTGNGWSCDLATLTCSRTDALLGGASYPPITLTVDVSPGAPGTIQNTATVAGGGELITSNDTASDSASVSPVPDIAVTSTHSPSLTQGDSGKWYRLLVRNGGGSVTTGTVSLTAAIPAGLTATAIDGSGWNCTLGALSCTRSDALAAGASYPAVTVTIDVDGSAASSLLATATVSGGGETYVADDVVSDRIVIWSRDNCGAFGAPQHYAASYPAIMLTGDFDNDGNVDVLTWNNYPSTVRTFLGKSDGTFVEAPTTSLATVTQPNSIVSGDLDHDGKLDLIIGAGYPSTVYVYRGNGDGTFSLSSTTPLNISVSSMAVADFDRDGNLDVVVSYTGYSTSLILLEGLGTGAFRSPVTTTLDSAAGIVVAGDFDGDSVPDLVLLNNYSGKVCILKIQADGTFQQVWSYALYGSVTAAVADLNGDGKLDLAVSTSYYGASVFIGNGDCTLQNPTSIQSFYGGYGLTIQDTNSDGKLDLVLSSSSGNRVAVARGNGDGTFQPASDFSVPETPSALAIGDFNHDGKPDLVVQEYSDFAVLLGGCADLTIAKSHYGNFVARANYTYTVTVSNSGNGASTGTVTVTDILPSGLTATSLFGYGWTCDQSVLRCTRSDGVLSGSSYPPIFVYVDVASDAPASVTNVATVSGGGDINPSNNSASDPTTINQIVDLTVTMSHSGGFIQGQVGRTYTVVVKNIGGGATSAGVSVVDIVPPGLTVTSMAGVGWNCFGPSVSCLRSDALAGGASYPPITVTVNVDSNAPASITNVAVVSGGNETIYTNDRAEDVTAVLVAPGNFRATAASTSTVNLTWSSVAAATSYQVFRSSSGSAFSLIATTPDNVYVDSSLNANTAYLYRVRATDGITFTAYSGVDLVTTIVFTDDPLVPGATRLKTVHVSELRTAINAVRVLAGLGATTFTDPNLIAGSPMKALHLTQLRAALDAARSALGLTPMVYTDPNLAAGMVVKATHIRELRSGVQ
jgi:uncharacterized repeat protein (TIGR01451 family)